MNATQIQEIINALNHAAGAGWSSLVRQQVLSGFEGLVWCGLLALLGCGGLLISRAYRQAGARNFQRELDVYEADKAHQAVNEGQVESERVAYFAAMAAADAAGEPIISQRRDFYAYRSEPSYPSGDGEFQLKMGGWVSLGLGLIFLAASVFLAVDAVGHLVNPAGYALQQLLSSFTPASS